MKLCTCRKNNFDGIRISYVLEPLKAVRGIDMMHGFHLSGQKKFEEDGQLGQRCWIML